MGKGRALTVEERQEIDDKKKGGAFVRRIARDMKRSRHVISNYLKDREGYGTKKGSGRPKKITDQQEKDIVEAAINGSCGSANEIKLKLKLECNIRTIQRVLQLKKVKITKKKTGRKPPVRRIAVASKKKQTVPMNIDKEDDEEAIQQDLNNKTIADVPENAEEFDVEENPDVGRARSPVLNWYGMEDEADEEEAGEIQNISGNGEKEEPKIDDNMEDVNIPLHDVYAINRIQDRDPIDEYPRAESPEPPHMDIVADSEEGEDEYEEDDDMVSSQESKVARPNTDCENDLPANSIYHCPPSNLSSFMLHSRTQMASKILSRIPKDCAARQLPCWNPMNYMAWQGNESSRSEMISKEIEMTISGLKRFVKSDQGYLLLENDSTNPECSLLNTICNLLFSCKEIRYLFQDYCQNEILDLMTAIFRRDKQTTNDLRRILGRKLQNGVQDVRDTFSDLIKKLKVDLTPIQFLEQYEKNCEWCTKSDSRSTGEVKESSYLWVRKSGTFQQSLEDSYMPTLCSERCEHGCGGKIYRKRVVTPKGRYHVMMVDHAPNKILNLTTDSIVEMFGFKWTVISFAEFCPRENSNGHYVSWMRCGMKWICVDDEVVKKETRKVMFSEHNVRALVFEKYEPSQ